MQHTTIDFLRKIADELRACEHRGKGAIIARAQEALGLKSAQAVYTRLAKVGYDSERASRKDAGIITLSRAEAEEIAAVIKSTTRDVGPKGKRGTPVADIVEMLRGNGTIKAQRIDQDTGEVRDLSISAISNALRTYGLHFDQLAARTPHVQLTSLHPNHVWEFDFSICVLFYIRDEDGMRMMRKDKFNKNKPANVAKIENDRVLRGVIVDHTTHTLWLFYAYGAESAETSINMLMEAMLPREGVPCHGVPFVLYTDPGPGFNNALFKNFCRRMMINHIMHESSSKKDDAARATGSVEVMNNIVERKFESLLGLGYQVRSMEELQQRGYKFSKWFNATQVHSRYGMKRFDAWMTITEAQLRNAPSAEIMKTLAHTHPVTRTVSGQHYEITYARRGMGSLTYRLDQIPDLKTQLRVGEKVDVVINPYTEHGLVIVRQSPDGKSEIHFPIEPFEKNNWGYDGAAVIGESFVALPDTDAQTANKRLARIAAGVDTDEAAREARRKHAPAFAGIDPHAHQQTPDVAYLPKRGTDLEADAPTYVAPIRMLSLADAALELRDRIGPDAWTPDHYATLSRLYPNGVAETDLDAAHARITTRQGLRIVSGGASA